MIRWDELEEEWEVGLSGSTNPIAIEFTEVDFEQVNVGDSLPDRGTGTGITDQAINIVDTNAGLRILQVGDGAQPFLELIHRTTADGANNAAWDLAVTSGDTFEVTNSGDKAFDIDTNLNMSLYSVLETNGTRANIVTDSGSRTITKNDDIVLADGSSNAVDIELPAIGTVTNNRFTIKAIDITNTVRIITADNATIDGQATYTFGIKYESLTVINDGTNWFII